MTQQQYDAVIARLRRLGTRINDWRATRAKNSPMPPALWEEAAVLARELGVNPVRSALRINYESLRQRTCRVARPPAETLGFVRLDVSQSVGGAGTVVELSDAAGTRLTMRLSPGAQLDVARVVESFRGGRS